MHTLPRTTLPTRASLECPLTILRSRLRPVDPISEPSLAEFIRPPDRQIQSNPADAPLEVLDAHCIRARLTRQIQLVVLIHQSRRDAETAVFDVLELLAIPVDEAVHRRIARYHECQDGRCTLADDVGYSVALALGHRALLGLGD